MYLIYFSFVCCKKYFKLTLFMKNCFTFLRLLISRYSVWRVLVKCWSSPDWIHGTHTIFTLITITNIACEFIYRTPWKVRRAYISGTGLARSLIAINHCQNSATRRTTRAAGYHHQSRVLRDQRDEGSTGTGEGTEWDMEPVRYFRKLGPTIPVTFTWIHRITNTNSSPFEYKQWHKAAKKEGAWAEWI